MTIGVIGSRNFKDYELLKSTLDKLDINCIVSGGARGADSLAEKYANENNINTIIFKPDWSLGKGAGFIRNAKVINISDKIVAFWDGISKGTSHSIELAKKQNKEILYVRF